MNTRRWPLLWLIGIGVGPTPLSACDRLVALSLECAEKMRDEPHGAIHAIGGERSNSGGSARRLADGGEARVFELRVRAEGREGGAVDGILRRDRTTAFTRVFVAARLLIALQRPSTSRVSRGFVATGPLHPQRRR